MRSILYILLILCLTSTNLLALSANSKIVFWGFDAIYFSEWKDKKISLRPLLEHAIKNITAVSTDGNSLCILGMEKDSTGEALKPFLFDLKTQKITKLPVKNQPLFNLEIAPDGKRIAFLSYQTSDSGAGDFKLGIYEIVKESSTFLNGVNASRDTIFTWHPDGKQLFYTSKEGMIKSVNIADGKITSMFPGKAPAWSPDGNRLAYRSGSEIRIYDSTNKSTARAYKRNVLQSSMLGRLYWSPDGQHLSFNVASGLDGKELSYIVLEVTSKKSFTSYEGSYWGGAWLNTK